MKALVTLTGMTERPTSYVVVERLDDRPGPLDLKARALRSYPLSAIPGLRTHNLARVQILAELHKS